MSKVQTKKQSQNKKNNQSKTATQIQEQSSFEKLALEEKRQLMFERLNRIILQNMNSTLKEDVKIKNYSKEDIRKFNENPSRYQKQLIELSNYIYIISPQYRRLVHHFALMPTFDTHIVPYSIKKDIDDEKLLNTYNSISEYINFMNLKYEIPKITINCFKEDTFYGYVYETKDTFFIRKLPSKYCSISSIENGLLVFQFDFSYFSGRQEKLEEFGDEFKKKYNLYMNGASDKSTKSKGSPRLRWQEIDLKNSVCFKVNDDELTFSTPPFSGTFESVIEIDEFKKLRLSREKINNYKIIFEKIPLNTKDDNADSFLVSIEEALKFHSMTANAIDENVGLALTPFDIDTVDFTSGTAEVNRVNDSMESFWNEAGIASGIMGSEKANSGSIIQMSIKNDEAISFRLLRQIEKWINYKISKFNSDDCKFKVNFIDSTIYNLPDKISELKDLATYGLPVLTKLNSLVGIQGEEVSNLNYLENSVLELQSKFVPLANSHSSNILTDEQGRPTNDNISDSKDQTTDGDTNANRVK